MRVEPEGFTTGSKFKCECFLISLMTHGVCFPYVLMTYIKEKNYLLSPQDVNSLYGVRRGPVRKVKRIIYRYLCLVLLLSVGIF